MSTYRFGRWEIDVTVVNDWPTDILRPKQTHGGHIARAVELLDTTSEADGVYAKSSTLRDAEGVSGIGVSTADCLPLVLLADDAALALHVSRKTLINGLLDNVPRVLSPDTITQAFIGPHVCPEHFTFEWEGPEITRFAQVFPEAAEQDNDGTWSLSTRDAVQHYFDAWGVAEQAVEEDLRCTFEATELPSYRRSPSELERHVATIVKASAKA